jgi:ribosomal protein S18 acetylase RimI-like enzyme
MPEPRARLRPATRDDEPFLMEMLAEAASWDRPAGDDPFPIEDLLTIPQVADYVVGWGREDDTGRIAEVDGRPAGACWFRRFTADHPGYGFLGEDVPGMGLAVQPARRRRGLGTRLLVETIEVAREQDLRALSLSVASLNEPARRLYGRAGFVVVGREGDSLTMRLDLATA